MIRPGLIRPGVIRHGARLVLFTRFPEPGRAKTRLIASLGPDGAAALHRRLTEQTLATLRDSGLAVEVRVTGAPLGAFRDWLGQGVVLVAQGEGDLGARMARATARPPAILVGADVPDLAVRHLRAASEALGGGAPVVIGPAEDGGYYLLGLATPMPFLFEEMPWGMSDVLDITLGRLAARGITPVLLDPLADLDRPEDLPRWPALCP